MRGYTRTTVNKPRRWSLRPAVLIALLLLHKTCQSQTAQSIELARPRPSPQLAPSGAHLHLPIPRSLVPASSQGLISRPGMPPPALQERRHSQVSMVKAPRRRDEQSSILVSNRDIRSQHNTVHGRRPNCLGPSHMDPRPFTRALAWLARKAKRHIPSLACLRRIQHSSRRERRQMPWSRTSKGCR